MTAHNVTVGDLADEVKKVVVERLATDEEFVRLVWRTMSRMSVAQVKQDREAYRASRASLPWYQRWFG